MRYFIILLVCLFSVTLFSQEKEKQQEEFIPIMVEEKEAFISTKTGEYVFRLHEETDANKLKTTNSGVVYTEIIFHSVKKKETLFSISKKYNLTIEEIKKLNNLTNTDLNIAQKLKIEQKFIVKSSSPVISYDGEERIVARLKPNQNPWEINSPPPSSSSRNELETIATSHTVKSGETLFTIAKMYNMNVQDLKSLNKLTLNNLSVGQKLRLK